PVEPVGRNPHRHGVEAPPPLIALQYVRGAEVEAKTRGIDDRLGKRRDVAQPEIKPLAGDRMDHVRRVADEREALGHERARNREPERMHPARTRNRDVAEMESEALLQLRMKQIIGQRDDAFRLARLLGPNNRRAAAVERQDREGTGGEEMFLGTAAMVALM